MIKKVNILLPLPVDKLFTYTVKENDQISVGNYVVVPFGKRLLIGIVWKSNEKSNRELKFIEQRINLPSLRPKLIEFVEWVAQYNLIPVGMLAKAIIGGVLKVKKMNKLVFFQKNQKISKIGYRLSHEQQVARDKIISNLNKYSVTLLDGETGSGKTKVYLSVIAKLVEIVNDAQVLILLPEIILASELISHIHSQISKNLVQWHSGLTLKTRRNNWLDIVSGNVPIIVGARSALFLPYKNLKLIIVDEEHDSSFKQEHNVIYNARDMAIILAKIENIPIILSSATPLIETIYHVKNRNFNHVKLSKRFGSAELPIIKVVDMRDSKKLISDELFECIKQTIKKKQQVMLFLNLRGYAQLAVCKNCGYKISCLNCSIWLTFHKKKSALLCHHCFYQLKFPEKCFNCQSEQSIFLYGIGIERLLEETVKLIPNAKTSIISSDQKFASNIIDLVLKEKVNIIIGTQIIAKGHNFPKLTLVGVIDADLSLRNPDLRAAERTYQLLYQVAGRSGRFDEKGTVIIQTNNPESLIIKALQNQERDAFYDIELKSRCEAKMPPFSRLIALIISGENQILAQKAAKKIVRFLYSQSSKKFEILGPSPAAINFLKRRYRFRILIKVYNKKDLSIQMKLKFLIKDCNLSSNIKVTIDVDPVNFF